MRTLPTTNIAWRVPAAELRLCLRANRYGARPLVCRFFTTISRLGDGPIWYALLALLPWVGGKNGLSAALHMAATGIVAAALYKALKARTRRPRPFANHAGIVAHIPPLDEFSFPSGHTLHAVTFSLIAVAHIPLLAWVLVPFTVAVAVSRVVLGLHYPSDVLAAFAIGGALASASLYIGL